MISIYQSTISNLLEIDEISDGVWVNMINPNESEIQRISTEINLDPDFIKAALDEEERSRIDFDDETGNTLILVNIPFAEVDRCSNMYDTLPLGIIFTEKCIITVCLKESNVLEYFMSGNVKTFFTYKKSRFILQILYRSAILYLQYLKQIDKKSSNIEIELHKSMKNKELIELLDLEKSLVYFSTSLKSNAIVLEKLLRFDFIKKYPDDTELLEDTIIENKQAIEMAKIYSDILSGTMDAFASIISNNLNIVMKLLTSITIVMAIPTIVSSFWGMNVDVPFQNSPFGFIYVIGVAAISCIVITIAMHRRKMF